MEYTHIFVGTDTGLLKGVNITSKSFTNIATDEHGLVNKERAIDALFFEPSSQAALADSSTSSSTSTAASSPSKIRLCLRNRDVVRLDMKDPSQYFSRVIVDGGDGKFVGGGIVDTLTVTCVESGEICGNEGLQKSKIICTAGQNVTKMVQSEPNFPIFATGGRENHLKIWDVLNPKQPIFTAKNLSDDKLRLRVPNWIKDISFRPKTDSKIVLTATAYGQVHVYDTRANRRPVMFVNFWVDDKSKDAMPLTSLDLNPQNEFEFIASNTHGNVRLFDVRGTKGLVRKAFTGNAGTVKQISFHPTVAGHFATCGMDRILRFYEVTQKEPISEIYMKSQPTCFLFTDEVVRAWQPEQEVVLPEEKKRVKRRKPTLNLDDNVPESDSVWTEMSALTEDDLEDEPELQLVSLSKKKRVKT
ncbi:putative WD repeat-containing protein 74 [Hypsibius exemplaris]|uniref:WD repeat-containing protein 74 n=1 Tax=Hypsibius exemplaris TaxID=2072580 RepID=A0A1W0WLW8_HYPEX|nr:putative WD repeat-containing protein 74 [Hypsibius exemplaris]